MKYFKDLFPFIVTFHLNPKIQQILSLYSIMRGGSYGDFITYSLGYPFWNSLQKREFEETNLAVMPSQTSMKELTKQKLK